MRSTRGRWRRTPARRRRRELEPLSLLTVAVLDGVALQVEADPELDVGPAFDLWERLVLDYLHERDGGAAGEA